MKLNAHPAEPEHSDAPARRVLLDGKPGTLVRAYDALGDEPGYDVDLDDGTPRWVSHRSAKNRMVDL